MFQIPNPITLIIKGILTLYHIVRNIIIIALTFLLCFFL